MYSEALYSTDPVAFARIVEPDVRNLSRDDPKPGAGFNSGELRW
jgi:hypothetical protein